MMDTTFARAFVNGWIDAWNHHDLDRILGHYVDDFEMSSPLIQTMAGEPSGTLKGKAVVGAYWAKALAKYPDLHFDHVATFAGVDSIALQFRWSGGVATEVFLFGPDRKVRKAFAHHVA